MTDKMQQIQKISAQAFDYVLAGERIAKFPLAKRDQSKLLIYNQTIKQDTFANIQQYLPENSLLVFNETRVVQARIAFQKISGAQIEIFCLEPHVPTREVQLALQQNAPVIWKCMVGNAKKWKSGILIKNITVSGHSLVLKAEQHAREEDVYLIQFSWEPQNIPFAEILEHTGSTPIPPYLRRKAVQEDKNTYQTIYARCDGSVAAPTAGLHFTEKTLSSLKQKNISTDYLTLHVGAGTFKPLSSESVHNHGMHAEQVRIKAQTLDKLLACTEKNIIAVGTTSVRTLESLYWFGVKLRTGETESFHIEQWDPYQEKYNQNISLQESLRAVKKFMEKKNLPELTGSTQLMIVPGYTFKVVDVLITNFHQPKSTLLLLIAAFIGESWKQVYDYALTHDFRFLSYGDSCLLYKSK